MKRLLTYIVLGGASLGLALAQAPDQPKPPADAPPAPAPAPAPEAPGRPDKPPLPKIPMEKRTFLGVATGPVDPSLRAQLSIPRGTGLTVHDVDKESPAGKALQEHDILTKYNDQILVSHEQLAVLVENSKSGDVINLTLIRSGKEQTVAVTLAEHEVPVRPEGRPMMGFHPWMQQHGRGMQPGEPWREGGERGDPQPRDGRQRMEDMPRRPEGAKDGDGRMMNRPGGDPGQNQNQGPSRREPGREVRQTNTVRNATWVQDQVSLNLIENSEGRNLTITDDGKEVFRGPVNTDEEKTKVPEAYRESFERLESQLKSGRGPEAAAAGKAPEEVL
jgi:serine protease Do